MDYQHTSDDALRKIQDAIDVLSRFDQLSQNASQEVSKNQQVINDLLHENEFVAFTKKKSHEFTADLQKVQQNKRTAKEDLAVFGHLKGFLERNITFLSRLVDTAACMQREIDIRAKRTYTPRVRTEIGIIYATPPEEIIEPEIEQEVAGTEELDLVTT